MFGKRLADERKRLGMTQHAFVRSPGADGLTRSALAMIETDRAPLQVSRLVEFAQGTGVDAVYVLTGEASSVAAARLLDWSLVASIQAGIHDWCAEHSISLSPEKQTLLLKLLYERFSRSKSYSAEALHESLRLAA